MERDVANRLICPTDAILKHLDWGRDDDLLSVVFCDAATVATADVNTTTRIMDVRDDATSYKIVLESARLQLIVNEVAERSWRSAVDWGTKSHREQVQTYPYVESTHTDSEGRW